MAGEHRPLRCDLDLLEDEDGAPFPEEVQKAYRAAVADLERLVTDRREQAEKWQSDYQKVFDALVRIRTEREALYTQIGALNDRWGRLVDAVASLSERG